MFAQYPKQIAYIVGNEACERFSYYGMRSILVVYMTTFLLIPENEAKAVYHLFISAGYFLTLLGGFIADRYLGKYQTIIYFSLVYCLGHAVLAMGETQTFLYWGLALIALGAGGFKPCVSTHVGDQFHQGNKHLLEKVFEIFYWMTNLGAFASSFLIPIILPKYGPGWAFGIPGILMALATLIFWMGRKYYVYVPPSGKAESSHFFAILFYAIRNLGKKQKGSSWLDTAKAAYASEKVEATKAAMDVFKVLVFISAFWALYDQQGSTWVLQAERMNPFFLGFQILPAQIQAVNPLMLLLLVPVFSVYLYPAMKRLGFCRTPIAKMKWGMWATVLAFLSVAAIEVGLKTQQLNIGWVLIPCALISAAEIMVSITGLEFAYTQAPRSMKSTIMSLFFLTIFIGNFFTAFFSWLDRFSGLNEILFYTGMMAVVSTFFGVIASRYKERNYVEPHSVG